MQTLPFKVRSDSLSVHAEVNHQGEAGSRAQSELNQIRHTGAKVGGQSTLSATFRANGGILW